MFDAEMDYEFDPSGYGYDGWKNSETNYGTISTTDKYTGDYSYGLTSQATSGLETSVSFADDTPQNYFISGWVKSFNTIWIEVIVTGTSGSWDSTFAVPGTGSWQRVEQVVAWDLSGVTDPAVASIEFTNNHATAFFDDLRFHPVDAIVSTSVYDIETGWVVAAAGNSNLPTRYVHDKFGRVKQVMNHASTVLFSTDHHYVEVEWDPDTILAFSENPLVPPYWHEDSESKVIDLPQKVSYQLQISSNTYAEAWAIVKLNGDTVDYISRTCPQTNSSSVGSFNVTTGDVLYVGAGGQDCRAPEGDWEATSRIFYSKLQLTDPDDNNYVRSSVYRPGSDSTVSYTYFDGKGRQLQTRTTAHDGDSSRTFVAGVAEYDGRSRITKAYKPYYDLIAPST